MNSKKNILLLLKSMEHVKAKLNADQKVIIKKAEKKISKIIMKTVPSKITEIDDLKILNLILKINLTNEKVEEKLKILAQSILDDIFMVNIVIKLLKFIILIYLIINNWEYFINRMITTKLEMKCCKMDYN